MAVRPQSFFVSPSSGLPIFRQLMDQVHALAAAGSLQPGDMLPSTRELAAELQVNMMTVSKAYSALAADGVVENVRGRGMRMAEPSKGTRRSKTLGERKSDLRQLAEPVVYRGRTLGLTDEQILAVISHLLEQNPLDKPLA